MMRLVKRGLMFGNLYEVNSTALVGRYNRALAHLTGLTTALNEFHIDISGYSPEIGEELGNQLYLNPEGLNRQFILLSIEQRTAPLLNAHFSMSRTILKDYFDMYEEQLFALTARDAVVGELVNSIYSISKPLDLFSLREIEVEADTVESHVEASDELTDKIFQFMEEPDAWWDDVLICEMVELSKRTGDIIRNPIELEPQKFKQNNFFTRHFGGMYVFREMEEPACIAVDTIENADGLPVEYACTLKDRYDIAAFFKLNDLVEPISEAKGVDAQAILKQKMDFLVIDVAANKGEELARVSRRDLRHLTRKFFNDLPEEYHMLDKALRAFLAGEPALRLRPDEEAYFYLLRSKNHPDKHLVNMLLGQLTPLDFRQLYICHKDTFYAAYRTWGDAKRTYVAQFLAEEYAVDKAGAREELFGAEYAMEEDFDEDDDDNDFGFGKNRGPWGAIPQDQKPSKRSQGDRK